MSSYPVVLPAILLGFTLALSAPAAQPAVGQKAPDFALSTLEGKLVRLSEVNSHGPVVLIVLRGYPGYQCPFCNRQARDIMKQSQAFAQRGTRILMVYPGPGKDLGIHAKEFLVDKDPAAGVETLLDPDYKFTDAYGLR